MDYNEIHKRLLRHLALSIEILFNNNDSEISEYDVQAFLASFLKQTLANTNHSIRRESLKRFDCAISEKDSGNPVIFFELKTYLKPHEKLNSNTQFEKIRKDLEKLTDILQVYPNAKAYFLLAVRSNQTTKETKFLDNFRFLKERVHGSLEWQTIIFEEDSYKLRPSIVEKSVGRTSIYSWEIKK